MYLLPVGTFVLTYLFLLNVMTFLGVGIDKLTTKWEPNRSWADRTINQMMHFYASAGGGVLGIVLGMVVFRYRVGKRWFMIALLVATIISIMFTGLLAWAYSQLFVIDTSNFI